MRTGRPSKLTPEVRDRLFNAIAIGATMDLACRCAGLNPSTVSEWVRRGEGRDKRPPTPEFAEFAADIRRAIADSELKLLSRWSAASKHDWRAAMALLARRFPERWSDNRRIQVEVRHQIETGIDMLFERIMSDPDIPLDSKRKFLAHADSIQHAAAVGGLN